MDCYYNYKQRVVYKWFRTLAAESGGVVLAAGWWENLKQHSDDNVLLS